MLGCRLECSQPFIVRQIRHEKWPVHTVFYRNQFWANHDNGYVYNSLKSIDALIAQFESLWISSYSTPSATKAPIELANYSHLTNIYRIESNRINFFEAQSSI
jgi:hypothetical protein